ncbi:unnamed protein product [Fusarium equiseti]|uniref:Uncharacterized protein n=1 Tax=Fusarium equiseti TaxID=61235 RepID=A0A8J2IRA6_FUSEQ|nr:unnamed protein product [Fusarium equiseti]
MPRPAWFYRIQALNHQRCEDQGVSSCDRISLPIVEPEDFDEDLSDCVSESSSSDSGGGDYEDNQEYYHLEELRTERKMDVYERGGRKKILEEKQKRDREEQEFEISRIKPIQEAIDKVQKQKSPPPLKHFFGKEFTLWSTDHVKHCPNDADRTRYLELCSHDMLHELCSDVFDDNREGLFDFDDFIPPKYPSTKAYPLPSADGESKVEVQFIEDHHLTLKISPELIFSKYGQHGTPVPSGAPSVFTYYGEDTEYSAQQARQQKRKKGARRRSASPG